MNGTRLKELRKPTEIVDQWPTFLRGLTELNASNLTHESFVPERFLQELFIIVGRPVGWGIVALLVSKNGKPIGFVVGHNNSSDPAVKSLLVTALWKRDDCKTAALDIREGLEAWGRQWKYEEVQILTRKWTGASMRFLKQKMGFRFRGVRALFSRKI